MLSVGVFEAKTNLSKYISAIVNKEENTIIIVRSGKPVARLVPYESETKRIGFAKGILPEFPSLDEFNSIDLADDFAGNGGLI